MDVKDTPVVAFLRLAWEQANQKTGHSWHRLNHAMRTALELAIGAGFPFEAADFVVVYGEFRGSRWVGAENEWVYSFAVSQGNQSAARAWETFKGREPIIGDEVDDAKCHDGYQHGGGQKQTGRLHVGCSFLLGAERLKVTSFSRNGQAVIACSYYPRQKGEYTDRVKSRRKVTAVMIQADRADRKEHARLHDALMALVKEGKTSAEGVLSALGIKTRQEYNAMSVKKIRRVLARLQKE